MWVIQKYIESLILEIIRLIKVNYFIFITTISDYFDTTNASLQLLFYSKNTIYLLSAIYCSVYIFKFFVYITDEFN